MLSRPGQSQARPTSCGRTSTATTLSFCLSALTSSTLAEKFANGPSTTRTESPGLERDAGLGLSGLALGDVVLDARDLALGHRRRLHAAEEARDLRGVLDEVERAVVEDHLDEHVAGEELAGHRATLTLDVLRHALGRNEDVAEELLEAVLLHALDERQLRLVLVTRVGVDDVPLLLGARREADRRPVDAVAAAGAILPPPPPRLLDAGRRRGVAARWRAPYRYP